MSTPDAANWQDDQPLDGVPEAGVEHIGVETSFDAGGWGEDTVGAFDDPSGGNLFSAEIENVSPSDWDIDTSHIWDDGDAGVVDDHGDMGGLGFSL